MEVKNRLLNFSNKVIYQNDDWFSFSIDSVLLANFVDISLRDKNIIDFCTGNAPIPMLISCRTNRNIIGVELQPEIFNLGLKSVKENNLESRISLLNEDVRNLPNILQNDYFDVITCNPPYFKTENDLLLNDNMIKTIARHEISLTLEDVFLSASKLLKTGKKIALVHRPERLIEIISIMKKYNIEPKRIRLCYPKSGADANILLIEGVKNGKIGLKFLPPLYVHNEDGSYTSEVRKMFEE